MERTFKYWKHYIQFLRQSVSNTIWIIFTRVIPEHSKIFGMGSRGDDIGTENGDEWPRQLGSYLCSLYNL